MTRDLLQIKIEEARKTLPQKTLEAIDAVDWKKVILEIRETDGYSISQMEDLEIETELLLCGIIDSTQYPKELEKRMNISKTQVSQLIDKMNKGVFKKIREELIKKTKINEPAKYKYTKDQIKLETKRKTTIGTTQKEDREEEYESREELLKTIEKPELISNYELKITNEKKEVVQPEKKEGEQIIKKEITPPIDLAKQKELGDGKDIHPILAQKLSSVFKMERKETEHSIGNITKSEKETVSEKPKVDPYRELPV